MPAPSSLLSFLSLCAVSLSDQFFTLKPTRERSKRRNTHTHTKSRREGNGDLYCPCWLLLDDSEEDTTREARGSFCCRPVWNGREKSTILPANPFMALVQLVQHLFLSSFLSFIVELCTSCFIIYKNIFHCTIMRPPLEREMLTPSGFQDSSFPPEGSGTVVSITASRCQFVSK